MPADQITVDELLDPISISQPAGADMRWTAEWDRIREARRSDDALGAGKWEKKERKSANWHEVAELTAAMLRERTKDLQLALWLTEANTKLQGFRGLGDGLRVTRELMERYWDQGLFPAMEDGVEDRSGPFEWLNNKLVDSIVSIPITLRTDHGQDYSLIDLQDAKRIGSEASCRDAEGEVDSKKKKAYEQAIAEGHVSIEMFEQAVRVTRRPAYEEFTSVFLRSYDEFKSLERVVDEKFGDLAPNLSACRRALSEIEHAISEILIARRKAEPDIAPGEPGREQTARATEKGSPPPTQTRLPQTPSASNHSWNDAENLVRSGQVEKGLAEMTRLAASETCGRHRFERKLLLAEVCLSNGRERIARLVLEELAEQIDKLQLELWESTELISSVWTPLYRIYKRTGDSDDAEHAGRLYERLCRLDPWQALGCDEG